MASAGAEKADSTDDPASLTRRQFLAGVGMVGATAVLGTVPDSVSAHENGAIPGGAQTNRNGSQLLAEQERFQQQQGNGIQFSRRINAVEDLGCDPNGNQPVQDAVNNAVEDGAVVVFPPGTYRATGPFRADTGTFGVVGAGIEQATQPPKPGPQSVTFVVNAGQPIDLFNFQLDHGLVGNFVIDQRAESAHGGVKVRSRANVRVRDIRTVGAQTVVGQGGQPGFFTPFADGSDSLVVYERCIARGGGVPGTKNTGGSPGFSVFGRKETPGTVTIKDCVIENMADNGIYGSRTTSQVIVTGGLYRNNDVSQIRVNGDARVDRATVVIDEKNYTGVASKSRSGERGPGWPNTNGIKIETKSSISAATGTPITNCEIVGASVSSEGGVGGLISVFPHGGAVTVDNCRVTNNISETTSIVADPPGSGQYPPAPRPWDITVKNSVIQGSGAGQNGPAIKIRDRPRSLVTSTCFAYPDASKNDIEGAGVSDCGFGNQCQSAGLRAPNKVGSGGSLSTIPLNVSHTGGSGGTKREGPSPGIFVAVIDGIFLLLFTLFGIFVLFVAMIVGAFGALVGILDGD